MKNRFFILNLLLPASLMWCKFSAAQQITYTQHFVKRIYNYQKSFVLPHNKLLVIYGKNDWLSYSSNLHLIIHDENGNAVAEKFVSMQDHNFPLYFKDVFTLHNTVYFLCINNIRKTSQVNYVIMKFDMDSLNLRVMKEIEFNPIPFDWSTTGDLMLCYSPDSSKLGIITTSPMQPDFTRKVSVDVLDTREMKLSEVSIIPLGDNANVFQAKDFAITNKGNFLMLVKFYINAGAEIFKGKSSYRYILQQYYLGKLRKSVTVTPDINLVRDAAMQQDAHGNRTIIASYECDTTMTALRGIRLYAVSSDSLKIERTTFIEWPTVNDTTIINDGTYRISIDGRVPYNIFLDNQKIVSVNSSRPTHTFDYYRGKLLWLETDSLLNKKELFTIDKYQLMENIPEPSFVFDRKKNYISYVQNQSSRGKEMFVSYNAAGYHPVEINDDLWSRKKYYDILVNNNINIIQPQGKKYLLLNIKLK